MFNVLIIILGQNWKQNKLHKIVNQLHYKKTPVNALPINKKPSHSFREYFQNWETFPQAVNVKNDECFCKVL